MDPTSVPQLAIPVTLPHKEYTDGLASPESLIRKTGCLILVEFYFVLRVGEYTKPKTVMKNGKRVSATLTKQLLVGNVEFFHNGMIMPRNSPLDVLLTADLAVLKKSNQKNGCMDQTKTQHATGITICPVHALAHIVYAILAVGGYESTLLCSVSKDGECIPVESHHIIAGVRAKAKKLKLNLQAIDPDLVGAHSIHAGDAMALKLHGNDDTTIMKMGRWTSLTFFQYIQNQISHLSKDISQKMGMPLTFVNVAAI